MKIKPIHLSLILLLTSCVQNTSYLEYPTLTIENHFISYCRSQKNSPKNELEEFRLKYSEFKNSAVEANKHDLMITLDRMKRAVEHELFLNDDRVLLTISISSDKHSFDTYYANNNTSRDSLSDARGRFENLMGELFSKTYKTTDSLSSQLKIIKENIEYCNVIHKTKPDSAEIDIFTKLLTKYDDLLIRQMNEYQNYFGLTGCL